MESSRDPPLPHGDGPAVCAKKLRRVMRAVYLSLVEKHQPKVAALGVHLHRLLSSKRQRRAGEHLAPLTLSCRSMDPAAAVVHPLPRDHGGGGRHRRKSSSSSSGRASSLYSSLSSCRSVDPAAAAYHQYRPREVQFSFKSSTTPLHKRRRRSRRLLHHHHGGGDDQGLRRRRDDDRPSSQPESCHGSAAAVTRLFELLDVEDEDEGVAANKATDTVVDLSDDDDGGDLDPETATAWPALLLSSAGPAPRQVRITDSPFPVTEADGDRLMVDRRADEFIAWFHEQLRTQQQRAA